MFRDREYSRWDFLKTAEEIAETSRADVERVLSGRRYDISTLPALLSPQAGQYLEEMAQIAAERTRERFGNVIQLYAPLYLSNECSNKCVYCCFSLINKDIRRRTLTLVEVEREFEAIAHMGIKHVLLVSGEAPAKVSTEYLKSVLKIGLGYSASLGVEIYPMKTDEYKTLVESGAESLTIYQETYEEKRYYEVHPAGRKRDISWRLDAPERAGEAGFKTIGVGALLGLNKNTAADIYFAALHADYLKNRFWKSSVNISLPRIKRGENSFTPYAVADAEFVQYLLALRMVFYDAGLTLSTRENSALRDNLIGLGVTQLSAASKTEPGGYSQRDSLNDSQRDSLNDSQSDSQNSGAASQFQVEDTRSVQEIIAALKNKGFEGVLYNPELTNSLS
jgi:2-iminoacetate synthase